MLALRLFLKDKCGGKQHCLIPFVGSKLGVEEDGFLKKMEHQKRMRYNRGLRYLCILCIEVSGKFYVKPVCFLIVFLVIKGILKALFYFIPWLLNFSDLPNYDSNSRKRLYTKAIVKVSTEERPSPYWGKVPPTLWYPLWFP